MAANYLYDPQVYTFTNESQVTISHTFGREVGVEVYIGDEIILPDVQKIDMNTLTVSFYEKSVLSPKTGRIIIQ